MSYFTREQITTMFDDCLTKRVKKTGEVAITFNHNHKQFCLLNREEMDTQMKIWRKMRKDGGLKIKRYNSKTAEHNGKTYHFFVIQPYENGKMEECNFDPMGLFILGEMVSGYIYAFPNKANRDAVEKWVMGKYDDKEEEQDEENDE